MTTFLAGGTGTPKLLDGLAETTGDDPPAGSRSFDPAEVTVVGNTGDDVELGGLLVCPDLDTVLFHGGGVIDRETWWGIADDTTETNAELHRLADAAGLDGGPRYLPPEAQTEGREIARWRRFSGVAEFMEIGDRDRAVHLTRTSLLDEGRSLTEVTVTLADAFELPYRLLPMSDDPVATVVHTDEGAMHFQEFWVARRADPAVEDVEFRGAESASPTDETLAALRDPVVIGPSNPVTSVGPMLALPGVEQALAETPVVAVSPFVEDRVFSGPADDLMRGIGYEPSTDGVAEAYPFADAFVLDSEDGTDLDAATDGDREPVVVRTDTSIAGPADAARVRGAAADAFAELEVEAS
jgi:LPPG:FO 2-phospho-L-lactate transferase